MHAMTTPTPQPQPHAQMQSLQLPPPMPSQQQERDPALHTRLVLAHGGIPTKIPPADSTVTVMAAETELDWLTVPRLEVWAMVRLCTWSIGNG